MALRCLLVACAGLALACGSEAPEPSVEAPAPPAEVPPIAGMYEVSGVTVDEASGAKREITGTVILAETGDQYTATFHLETTYPTGGKAVSAEVIGKGSGSIEGRTLSGTAETQLVIAAVPGIDPGFAYIPRTVTTRIASKSVATVADDGTVQIQIENQPGPGEQDYRPSRTTLRGTRVASAATDAARPVAADQGR